MKPLIVLIAVFSLSLLSIKLLTQKYDWPLAGRIAMCVMLCFTAIAHVAFTKGMTLMIPEFIPLKTELVYLTGVLEIILGIGLLVPNFTVFSAWALIAFFILLLPANIYAAMHHIDYQQGTFDGNGPAYLWFRVPLQLFFIGWTYASAIKWP